MHAPTVALTCAAVAAIAACGDGDGRTVESCEPQSCVRAPPPICEGTVKSVFQAVGTCTEDGTGAILCTYPIAQQQDCALLDGKLCRDGQCVEPPPPDKCEGVVCTTRPAPDCDGHIARIYAPVGGCDLSIDPEGGCVYGFEAALDCTLSGNVCRDGGCVDPADFPCEPSPCDVPPQGMCSGNLASAAQPTGTCTVVTVDNRSRAECAYDALPAVSCAGDRPECHAGACARTRERPDAGGELVIHEVSKNPASPSDEGEWLELHNPTDAALDLAGCRLQDDQGEAHTIGELVVPAGGYVVLGASLEPRPNGGFVPDYLYAGVTLANDADEVVIVCGGTVIDRVVWDDSFPDLTARTMSLDPGSASATANDQADAWCDAPRAYGDGTNFGSPRRPNPACP